MRLRAIYYLMWADSLERMRRYSFFVVLILTLSLATLLVPESSANYAAFTIDNHRGVYNAPWIGMTSALSVTLFLSYAGFYLVRNAIRNDEFTGIGQILAGTPLTSSEYLVGKMLSNSMILTVITLITALATPIMFGFHGEDRRLDIWSLLSPFLFITWPSMVVIAALAVCFEATPRLRGFLGHMLHFLTWGILFTAPINSQKSYIHNSMLDPMGYVRPIDSLRVAAQSEYAAININNLGLGFNYNLTGKPFPVFHWIGMHWNAFDLAARLLWVVIAVIVTIGASRLFSRFDTALISKPGRRQKQVDTFDATEWMPLQEINIDETVTTKNPQGGIRTITRATNRWYVASALLAELHLMLKGLSPTWSAIAVCAVIGSAVLPIELGRTWVLPIIGLLPLKIWSTMGSREQHFGTSQVIFSIAHPLGRQLPISWLGGVLITLSMTLGMLIHFIVSGDGGGALSLITGTIFIPTLALTLGIWTGSRRLFEFIYLIIWYIGPFEKCCYLDFLGVTKNSMSSGATFVFFIVTILLGGLAIAGRKRQLAI